MKMHRRQFLWIAAATPLMGFETRWRARWITLPGALPNEYGVYNFRRTFDLSAIPAKFVVRVTADNRYQLFVNGARACWGPARGDLNHWHYETVDIAPYLRQGKNALAAVVWNDGADRAVAQFSLQTGFLLAGESAAAEMVNTGPDWFGIVNRAYSPIPNNGEMGYYAAPPGERVEGAVYPWGWARAEFDDGAWRGVKAIPRGDGSPRGIRDASNGWMLVPRTIPAMEETPQKFARVRQREGVAADEFPWQIPAQSKATLLLDQGHLTTAFPELVTTGGRGANVTLRYAESLFAADKKDKGNRDEVDGKVFLGMSDIFTADAGLKRLYRPLYWRTFRYVQVEVETRDEALTVEDLRSVYTGYPFQRKATFAAGDPALDKILDVGWRTARLCAHETYMDCPYYEQLQYVGDTRVQCLVSVYNSGDIRLMRNAIEQIDASRTAEGATFSRAPSALPQYIPGFSLWWIGMVHDYWMYADDPELVTRMLPGVRAVLEFFAALQKPNGSLGPMPWWNYLDWVEKWPNGEPPRGADNSSAPQDLQLAMAYAWAAEMETKTSDHKEAAEKIRATVRTLYWDAKHGLFADTSKRDVFSQHTNALAVLAGVVTGAEARSLIERTLAAPDLAPASVYFRYYLHAAMVEAGLGDRYLEMLAPWKDISLHVT
jgi:alpha-L-rhamnosidase